MQELWQALIQVAEALYHLVANNRGLLVTGLLVAAWVAWWLWGADWRQLWPALRAGAWAPVVLLTLMVALVWSSLAPSIYELGNLVLPNFFWQLIATSAIVSLALICGWLQGLYRWAPREVSFEPAVHGHGHDDHHGHVHDRQHGHGQGHSHVASGGHH